MGLLRHDPEFTPFCLSAVMLALVTGPQPSAAQDQIQAQDQATNADDQAREVITITGSRIGRKEPESKVPITVIPRAELDLQSSQTLVALVKDLPEVAGSLLTTAVSNGGGDGTSDITLRGPPSTQTLLLLNGHRLPPSKFGETPVLNQHVQNSVHRGTLVFMLGHVRSSSLKC